MTTNIPALAVDVLLQGAAIQTNVTDRRVDVLATLVPLDDAQRQSFVTDAWTVGVRAIMNAHRNAEEARLADIGKSILEDVDRELESYIVRQQELLVQMLKRYFDPKDGQVAIRIESFIKEGGEFARVMEKYLAPEHGTMARALAREVGEHSPLLRKLSTTDSEGIVHVLETRMQQTLEQSQMALEKALDPLAPDGAVGRLLTTLRKDMEKADSDRTKQLALATKALDANDETSLLSRLMRETHSARLAFVGAMNPDEPGSPLGVMKTSLTSLLEQQAKTQAEVMAAFEQRQQLLDQYIRDSVARLEERRRGDSRSARGGYDFEEAALRLIQGVVRGAPVVVDSTGGTVGSRPGCKVGDQVLRFSEESIYTGAALVVEVKHDASYSVSRALAELEIARSNRGAQVGVFVMARSHAPTGFPELARYGNDILVVWDNEDPSSDPYLQAAVFLGLALASRQRQPADAGDITALADIEHRIQQELARQGKMKKLAERIRDNAEELGDELRKGGDKLNMLLRNAKETLKALNVELTEGEEERNHPVLLPAASLGGPAAMLASAQNDALGRTEESA
jgi:gas vesicle protein